MELKVVFVPTVIRLLYITLCNYKSIIDFSKYYCSTWILPNIVTVDFATLLISAVKARPFSVGNSQMQKINNVECCYSA